MAKALVLGGNGMLGRALTATLMRQGISVLTTSRQGEGASLSFDANSHSVSDVLDCLSPGDFVVNAIGMITHRIDHTSTQSRLDTVIANSVFPLELAIAAEKHQLKVIQIATDCVFDGQAGGYVETDSHTATDVYGKSKSLGEADSESVMHLRCSIIGAESGKNLSLFEWVKNQQQGAVVLGYSDHYWNGVTTTAFAKVTHGIMTKGLFSPGVQHLVPSNYVSKANLVSLIAERCQRFDLTVNVAATGKSVNRTLATRNSERNLDLWKAAGYGGVPSVEQLVAEMPIN